MLPLDIFIYSMLVFIAGLATGYYMAKRGDK